jgi:integrase
MITTNALRAGWNGKDRWLSDGGSRNSGRLVARIRRNGVFLIYQYFGPDGERRLFPLGTYDVQGVRGISLPAARDRAAELSALCRSGVTDLHGYFEEKRREQERVRQAQEEAARQAQEAAQRGSLEQLLNTYTSHLEKLGKSSATDVRSIFKVHVIDPRPDLMSLKAAEVPVDAFVEVIGAVVHAGKGRTAAKLRSYLRSAYAIAIRSKTDPAAPPTMRGFGIVVNPLTSTAPLSQFNRTRKRNLNAPELAAFLRRLDAEEAGPKKDALELCIDLGGQRPTQLLRVREADVDLHGGTITLYDPKGARTEPRTHTVPLTASASKIVKRRLEAIRNAREEAIRNGHTSELPPTGSMWLFSTDGRSAMRKETISEFVKEISSAMLKAEEAREPFQLRDIRRPVETMLAKLGTAPNVRGELQSHGLSGVQKRHYDQHDYLAEKRAAVELWGSHKESVKSGRTSNEAANGNAHGDKGGADAAA